MARIEQLAEQTAFLLEKQKEAYVECSRELTSLLNLIKAQQEQEVDEEAITSLSSVYESLAKQSQEIRTSIQDDIDYLEGQADAIKKVYAISDPVRRLEIETMLLEDAGELPDTATFIEEITADAEESKRSLFTMIEDIKNALTEGGAAELEMLFASMDAAAGEEDEEGSCCSRKNCSEDEDDEECCESELDPEEAEKKGCCKTDSFDKMNRGESDEDGCCDDDEEGCCDEEEEGEAKDGCCSDRGERDECCGGNFSCGKTCTCTDACGCERPQPKA